MLISIRYAANLTLVTTFESLAFPQVWLENAYKKSSAYNVKSVQDCNKFIALAIELSQCYSKPFISFTDI